MIPRSISRVLIGVAHVLAILAAIMASIMRATDYGHENGALAGGLVFILAFGFLGGIGHAFFVAVEALMDIAERMTAASVPAPATRTIEIRPTAEVIEDEDLARFRGKRS